MRLAPLTADESRALLEQLTVALTRFEFHGLADRVETILSDYQPPKNNAVETLGNLVRTVRTLQPGDRVVLNCPSAKLRQKCEAQFEGVFATIEQASDDGAALRFRLMQQNTRAFSQEPGPWARFLLQTSAAGSDMQFTTPGGELLTLPSTGSGLPRALLAIFRVDDDGAMREEHGARVTVERRIRMGQG